MSDGIAYCYGKAGSRVVCPLCESKWGETREEGVVIHLKYSHTLLATLSFHWKWLIDEPFSHLPLEKHRFFGIFGKIVSIGIFGIYPWKKWVFCTFLRFLGVLSSLAVVMIYVLLVCCGYHIFKEQESCVLLFKLGIKCALIWEKHNFFQKNFKKIQ